MQWSGFKRIDKMIWALKHLRSDGLLGNFAEALAVEIGNQDFDIIKRIASASRDQLERPVNFVEDIFPSESKMDLEKNIWKAQVRVFLPWIEEWRQIFIEKYKRKLVIDEHQNFLGVENIEDIEIGGIRHQLVKKGFLPNIERDLIIALTKIRQKIAHGKVCNHHDFISARQKSITLGVND